VLLPTNSTSSRCSCVVPQVIKCRLQVQGASLAASGGSGVAKYAGPIDCALQVVKHEGLPALLKGLPALLARDIPFNALFFGCYDAYCKLLCALPLPWRSHSGKSDMSGPEFALAVWLTLTPVTPVAPRCMTLFVSYFVGVRVD
jgi:solute carrier family 25 (mitochondrial carnitine/acylcarnitine transporter), member 20/29